MRLVRKLRTRDVLHEREHILRSMPRTPAQRRIPHDEPIDPDVDLEPHRLTAPEQVRSELETLAADGTTLTAYPQGLHTLYQFTVRRLDAQPLATHHEV